MTDIRQKVEDDRGLLKKIQLAIPGFRGYREREDLRIADRLLREQLADKLGLAVRDIEASRDNLANNNDIRWLDRVGKLVNDTTAAQNKLRHAEQGYTGVSPEYRIEQSQLHRMYDWDLGLLYNINNVKGAAEKLKDTTSSNNDGEIEKGLDIAREALVKFDELFDLRREAIAGLLIGGTERFVSRNEMEG